MRVLIIAVFLCYHCSIVVDGEVQSSLKKGIHDGKIFQQNDNNTTNKFRSSFRHAYDERDQAVVQQSSALVTDQENRRLDTTQNIITTYAGTGLQGYSGDGGAATSAQLYYPNGVSVDNNGNVYIVDFSNHRIRKVSSAGIITTYAGTGSQGFSGDGGAASSAQLYYPLGVLADNNGNVYIADTNNNVIRKVSSAGFITTYAGTGSQGFSGDGGAASSAQLYYPNGVSADNNGNLYIADEGNNRIRKVNSAGIITTFAGTGSQGYSGDGGAASSAQLNEPSGVFADSNGNVYIADWNSNRIRKVSSAGIITTYAGTGSWGYSGDGGAASSAQLYGPYSVFADSNENVYIADSNNNRIRKVNSAGIITTFAGTGSQGYSGDGGAATSAQLYWPNGVSVDNNGNVYIVDKSNNRIRKVFQPSPTSLPTVPPLSLVAPTTTATQNIIIITFAGTGLQGSSGDLGAATSAQLYYPQGISADNIGDLYIADTGNNRVRKVNSAGIITTYAGTGSSGYSSDGGAATSAQLNGPIGLSLDNNGNLYIADTGNNRIRKVNSAGIITTFAGTGSQGSSGDGGAATSAQLSSPRDVSADNNGNVFIADWFNNRIRKVSSAGIITTFAGTGSAGSSGDGGAAISAQLYYPQGVFADNNGNVYIADTYNNRIRKVNSVDIITTYAGTGSQGYSGDGGAASSAQLYYPLGVSVDNSGNVYITDNRNNRIRKVSSAGIITTIAGTGPSGINAGAYSGDGGAATSAQLYGPYSVFADNNGNVYIGDTGNNRIRKLLQQSPTSLPSTPPSAATSTMAPTQPRDNTATFTGTTNTDGFSNYFITSLDAILPAGPGNNGGFPYVVITSVVSSNRRAMRNQLRHLLSNTVLQIDYTVTSNAFVGGIDALTTFLLSASTLSQLTTALQTAYPSVTVSFPVLVGPSSPSLSPLSPPPVPVSSLSPPTSSSSSSSSSIVIIAAAAGGGGGLLLLCLGYLYYQRARKAKAKKDQIHMDNGESSPFQPPQQKTTDDVQKMLLDSTSTTKMQSTVGTTIGTSASMMTPKNVSGGGFTSVTTDIGPVPQQNTLPIIDWTELMPSERIGQGSFSAVYRGVWKRAGRAMGQDVALKVMTKSRCLHDYENALKLAREEATLTHRLCVHDHLTAHVTEVFGFCEGPIPPDLLEKVNLPRGDLGFCIVMRHYSGGTLEDLLSRRKFSMLEKLQLLTQIVSSVAELHAVGITHGDLKPANFLLVDTTSLSVRIADFGMSDAKQALDGTLGQSALHRTGGTKGTPIYCAPEMLVSDDDNSVMRHSRSTDIYAFAIILWQILCQLRPFDHIKNAATLGIKVFVQGERPPLSDLPANTPAPVITIMQQCWAGDRTQRLSAARCLQVLAKELDVLEEQEAKKTGTKVMDNPLGKSMMIRAPQLEEMLRMQMMLFQEISSVKKGQEMLISGQRDLKEGQQEVLKGIRDLSEQLSRSLDGLGQSLTQLTAAAMRDEKVEHGVSALTSALEAHRAYLLIHGDASDAKGTRLSQTINDAMTSLDPALASNLQRYIVDVMSSSSGPMNDSASGSAPSQNDKLDALMSVMQDMQGELRSVRELANEQSYLLKVIEKRGNKMPHTFVILPDMGTEGNDTDASQLSMMGKIKSYLMRQKDKMMGLMWERSRLFFICPVTGQAVICGPPTSPHNGKGYLIKVPTAMVRALAPALQWGVIFLKVALASQGLGGILPIPIDWLPGQLSSGTDLTQLRSMVNDMDSTCNVDKDVKKYVEWEHQEAEHDAVKQNAMARVYKFIAEAEGNADDILNPAWIPQHTGLFLTTAKTTGASLWVSKEGQKAFETRGWDAVQKRNSSK